MRRTRDDFSVYSRLELERPPIAIKFFFFRPQGMEQLPTDKGLSFCEIFKEAQETKAPFYFGKENNETCVGKILLGMEEMKPFAESGQIGVRLGIFEDARANYAFYQYVPKFSKDTVNYVAFSTIDKLSFDPDVLIIAANPSQAEIVMRSMTYSTGELYTSKTTPVMGCAWSFIYPFQSGKVNYLIPEMIHGMKGRRLFPENTILVSIPYHWIPTMTRNLQEMQIHLPSHTSKEQYLTELGSIFEGLIKQSENP